MSDFDDSSEYEMLVDEVFAALANQSAIGSRLNQTIAHTDIVWRTKNGLKIEELSEDDALSFFDSGKYTYKSLPTNSGLDLLPIFWEKKGA